MYCQRGVIRNQSCFSPSPRLCAPPTPSYDLDPGLCQVPQSAEQDRIFPCGLLVCGSRPYGDPDLSNLLEQPYHHRGLLLGHKHKQCEHVCVCREQDLAVHVRRKPHCFLHRRKEHFFQTLSLRSCAAVLAISVVWGRNRGNQCSAPLPSVERSCARSSKTLEPLGLPFIASNTFKGLSRAALTRHLRLDFLPFFITQPTIGHWISISFGAMQMVAGFLMMVVMLFTVSGERLKSLKACCQTSNRVKFRE